MFQQWFVCDYYKEPFNLLFDCEVIGIWTQDHKWLIMLARAYTNNFGHGPLVIVPLQHSY